MNKWIGIGRLTKTPELRYLPSGVAVTTYTIAVTRDYKNDKGEKEADFIPILAWRGLAENCVKYLAKGRLVAVSGRIQTRSYDGKDGKKRYTWEVVADEVQFLEWGEKQEQQDTENTEIPGFESVDVPDDELPF